jgi:Fe-S oxidoreductase
LHLVVAPITIFFRSSTTSATRALRQGDDDDFGMLTFQHLSQKDILDLNACVECGRCTDYCPANVTGGSLDPKKVILQMQQGWLRGGETVAGTAEEVRNGKAWVSELDLYQCLSCGACEEACPVGIEHVGAKILDLRRGLVSAGRTHSDKLTDLFNTMERAPHNPLGLSHDVRQKFIETAGFPVFDGSQEWLFWLGCGNSYDPHGQEVARAMQKLLDAAGVRWGVLQRETCCGEPARRAGNEYLYMEFSEKVIDALQSKRVKQLVTCDPHCARMFDGDYRQNAAYQNLGIRVEHHSELLEELKARLPLKPAAQAVTFHDPCYLARGRGITQQPRTLLHAAGAQVFEPVLTGKQTFCCGAGGGQLYLADDRAESQGGRVNSKRFEQLTVTGAATIAVACPYCPIMLNDAAHAAGREDVRIADVAELLAERL